MTRAIAVVGWCTIPQALDVPGVSGALHALAAAPVPLTDAEKDEVLPALLQEGGFITAVTAWCQWPGCGVHRGVTRWPLVTCVRAWCSACAEQ